ncbi:uncharacterized protein PADG_11760 [Paracoccidioides brasiliensis Pb18]|uniref:Uncharacterized protein n=1 Tax=Paracoccidioides brasiliensis (strain Pb18) TaxID=502780 RepID=A0A0A0HUH8_PARBD|nr:uncharacterized protein PADG_11760 [Paracoccidioides brasiliensis Pb18]KGM92222.1 hypothetical protein PADG_11760 [Paracoccidioides brasiliensis Pb18]
MQYNYYSPWSVSNDAASGFLVRAIVRDSGTHVSVTSSEQAFEFLSQFCQQKKIQEQCLMGLATSLMFPTHNLTGVPVRLVSAESPLRQMEVSDDEKDADMKASFELLPYLMTISLHGLVPDSTKAVLRWLQRDGKSSADHEMEQYLTSSISNDEFTDGSEDI